jgi:hypothetical protein
VSAALRGAPPTLGGVTALLARFASLTRVQTGALFVALAVLPIGWHLKERHSAAEEVKRTQADLLDVQNQYAGARSDLDRLTADSQRLEEALVRANETAKRAAESAKAFDVWKKKIRTQLMADDYRWDDDSPFVRIRKSALPELAQENPFVRFSFPKSGTVQPLVEPYVRELLGLTPGERQSMEETLNRHFADVERKREAGIYETNRTWSGQLVDPGLPAKVFVLPSLEEDEDKQLADQLLAELHGILGEDRWPLVQATLAPTPNYSSGQPKYSVGNLAAESILRQSQQELSISLATNDRGIPIVSGTSSFGGMVGFEGGTLSMFLPEGDPNRTEGAEKFAASFSDALRQRAMAWIQEQAIARLGKGAKP